MDDRIEQAIVQMLRRNMVRSDAWIARRVNGVSAEMVTKIRFKLESRGQLPHISYYVDANGHVWPRNVGRMAEVAA